MDGCIYTNTKPPPTQRIMARPPTQKAPPQLLHHVPLQFAVRAGRCAGGGGAGLVESAWVVYEWGEGYFSVMVMMGLFGSEKRGWEKGDEGMVV